MKYVAVKEFTFLDKLYKPGDEVVNPSERLLLSGMVSMVSMSNVTETSETTETVLLTDSSSDVETELVEEAPVKKKRKRKTKA